MRIVLLMFLLLALGAPGVPAQVSLDTAAIAKALGREGRLQGDVYRVAFPRSDLKASVSGVAIRPGLALGTWIAFRRTDAGAIAHGDLVLLHDEINPVISKLQEGGIEITALHNHLIDVEPAVMYLHVWGRGEEGALARTIRAALAVTKTPAEAPPATPASEPDFDASTIQKTIGHTGAFAGGVLSIAVPRPEQITMMGVEMPPSMGMATAMNFQASAAGRVAATGDYVMTGDQVNPVARALRQHGIAITALHNHMIHSSPELYFMHFWADDAPVKVAAGLRAGLDAMK